jgi:hypothetical protein
MVRALMDCGICWEIPLAAAQAEIARKFPAERLPSDKRLLSHSEVILPNIIIINHPTISSLVSANCKFPPFLREVSFFC